MEKRIARWLASLLLAASATNAHATKDEIIFSTAPTHTPQETQNIYAPLIDLLTKSTGKKFIIKPAENFVEYTNNMRKGAYDMLFDGPHFVGWRMDRQGHVPLARFPGNNRIVVVVRQESTIKTLDDLVAQKVCAFASPNMLTMAFLQYYPNPARQPMLVREQGFKELEDCLRSGKGEAAVLRDMVWEKKMKQDGLRALTADYRSFPERTFSISKEVDDAIRQQIVEVLISEEGSKAGAEVLKRFNKDKFIKSDTKAYQGLGELLSPVWGFQ